MGQSDILLKMQLRGESWENLGELRRAAAGFARNQKKMHVHDDDDDEDDHDDDDDDDDDDADGDDDDDDDADR